MRIAISQRVDEIGRYQERRDALDQRWTQLLELLGFTPVPLPNGLGAPQAWARSLGIQGLLLSGGNDLGSLAGAGETAPERDRCEGLLLDMASNERWPVLGVCRGMQMLNRYLGGKVAEVSGHVAVRHHLRRTERPARLLAAMPPALEVNSFHGFGVSAEGLAPALIPVMCDEQGLIEAAEHRHLPWAAVMWHPEREPMMSVADRALLSTLFAPP